MRERNFENVRDIIKDNIELGIIINVDDFTIEELIKFATLSKLTGAGITFGNCMSLSKANLKKIAKAAKGGNLTIDLR